MLPKEQIPQIKKQVIEHINSTFPEDKKSQAVQQIESMNDEDFEQFLIQNKMLKEDGSLPEGQSGQCIFCSIVSGNIPSTKIDENDQAIAILEINPISEGHAIVIPKNHAASTDEIPNEANTLATKISEKIKKELQPKDVTIANSNLFGHEIINVLPVYNNETLSSEKKQAKPEEIQELQKKLTSQEPEIIEEQPKEQEVLTEENYWLPKRIP